MAWLDAIKETEEAPVSVTASAAPVEEPVASPYPPDPWRLVPQQHETPTPPLFRAAVDSVYGAAAAEDVPEAESEAGEWLGRAGVKEEPQAPEQQLDDPFLAPLKPLPRPDDTDTYAVLPFPPPEQVTDKPEQAEEQEETSWATSDWSQRLPIETEEAQGPGPAEEPAVAEHPTQQPGTQQPGTQLPVTEQAAKERTLKEEPAKEGPAREERVAWADTQPRAERPKWGDQPPEDDSSLTRPHTDRPLWSESSHTLPRNERPQWTDPEVRPQEPERPQRSEQQPEQRPQWSGQQPEQGPQWTDEPEHRPQWTEEPDQRPQWTDEPEHRPQWAEEPEHRPQWTEQQPEQRPQWSEQQPEWRPAEREIPPEPRPRRRPAPIPVFTAPPRPPVTGRPTAESLDPESLLRGRRNAPSKGWRRLIYKASGGWIKPGEPPEVRRRRELVSRARTPVTAGHHRVAVLSLKGGVGKTTTTVGLGATLAQMRGDRVIAVDANPDRGTLSDKLVLETSATVRDLLNERDQVKRYVDIRAFTSQAPSRLEILASDRDPSVSEAFSGADYQSVSQVLENFYSICITDCGTGLLHSAMGGVLGLADQIVLVSSPSVDGARAASATLDWLEAHHYGDLVKNATVVLCSVRPRSKSAVDIKKLEAHFAARCRAVVRVPYDPHLEEGAEIDLDRLQEPTREAYLQLAASVGDGFAGLRE
ncbi:nucleotide-binding protein [Nonomuraea sp. KM90]|uniref:nucleotide-binding protein n=1 Tax=Nonomuraea sp. KM90 TaxID=3457428 RepID=UPI003FCE14B5